MNKKIKLLVVTALTLIMAIGMTSCGSADKTQKLLSEIDFDNGYHIATETVVNGGTVTVDMYQRGDDFKVDAKTSAGDFIFLYKDNVLTLMDPTTKKADVVEMSEELSMQLAVFTSNGDLLKYLAEEDREYTESTMKLEGMEYDTEETEISEGVIMKMLYNDEGNLAYMVRVNESSESIIKVLALDGDVSDEDFEVPKEYSVSGSSTGSSGSSAGLVEVVNTAGGYSFMTSNMNRVNKVDERTMVYTNSSGDIPYFNVFIMDKGSTQNADSLLDAGIKQAQDKYQNRLPATPVKKTQKFNGYSASGIEYSYSTVDGTDMIMVQQYYIGMGDKWISFTGEFYSGDEVSQAEMYEAMATLKMK